MAVIALEDHQLTMRDALVGKAAALSLGHTMSLILKMCKRLNQLRQPDKAKRLAQSAQALFQKSGTCIVEPRAFSADETGHTVK